MSWLLAILLAPPALLLLVVALPFHARVRGAVADGELSGTAALGWAFWLVRVELGTGGAALRVAGVRVLRLRTGRRRGARERRRAGRGGRRERERGKGGAQRLRAALANAGRLLRIAARFPRALHLRLRVGGRVGTGDPADTVEVAAALQAARAVPGMELEVEVDWLDEVLDLAVEGSARAWAPELLVVAGLVLLRREDRAAVRALAS